MKSFEEIELEIHKLYSELGKDPKELKGWVEDFVYKLQRKDNAVTIIPRRHIDDYFDSEKGRNSAKEKIKKALNNFQLPK
jgi:hypothetical protein